MKTGIGSRGTPTRWSPRLNASFSPLREDTLMFIHCTGLSLALYIAWECPMRQGAPAGPFSTEVLPSTVNCASPSKMMNISSQPLWK